MFHWFLKSIGLSDDFVVNIENAKLDFHDPMALWIGLPLLVPVAYFIYRRQQRNLRTVRFTPRFILTTIRVLILGLLVFVLAGPYLKLDQVRVKKPIVAVLFDHSSSMELEVGEFEPESKLIKTVEAAGYRVVDGQIDPSLRSTFSHKTRARLVQEVVQHNADKLLTVLAEKYDIQFYSVADDAQTFGAPPGKFRLPDPPLPRTHWGPQTKLGDAVAHVLREAGGRQVAGIILFSDGQNTGGTSLSEAAREAINKDTPIFTVPAGASKRWKDVAVVDVFTSGLVSVGDSARVAVTVESQGLDNKPAKVQLLEDDKVLETKDLVLKPGQQLVELTYQAKTPGSHYLKVRIPPLPEEHKFLHANNEDAAFIRVTEGKLRVLYIEGLPRWDFRFLKNAMRRDPGLGGKTANKPNAVSGQPDIVVEAEWRRWTPARQTEALPRKLKELSDYHTIILGDVSPKLLTPDFQKLLASAVREKGVGLIIEAGPLHMPHDYDKRLLELLPVRMTRKNGRLVDGWVSYVEKRPFTVEVSPQGGIHDTMRLYDDPNRNKNAWSYMPPYYWCAAASRPAPAATVLAYNPNIKRHKERVPLIAHQYAGKGRVLFVGTDSTWLWRQNVGDLFFYKFWGQAVRYVARRDPSTMKKSWLEVRPLRAQPGERAGIELMAFTKNGSPVSRAVLPVQVFSGKKRAEVKLTPDPAVKGRYTGGFLLKTAGEYRVSYQGGSGTGKIEGKIQVLPSIEELRQPHVDLEKLGQLAAPTHGDMVELSDLDRIPRELVRRRLTKESLEALRSDQVPDAVVSRLERWRDKTFVTEKHLHSAMSQVLSPEEVKLYKGPVLERAVKIDENPESTVLKTQKDIWDNWVVLALLVFLYSLDVGMRRLAGLA
jgi:hypothetical protein